MVTVGRCFRFRCVGGVHFYMAVLTGVGCEGWIYFLFLDSRGHRLSSNPLFSLARVVHVLAVEHF